MRAWIAAVLTAALAALAVPVRAEQPVDVELVLAVDVSGSMDQDERLLQRAGYVAALTHPEVLGAIRSGVYGRVAITFVEWAGPSAQEIIVPWREVADAAGAQALAGELASAPTARIRGTSISGALAFAAPLFENNGYAGLRQVIDVSGDGPNNMGGPVTPVRDAVVARGIVINGLPIMLKGGSGFGSLAALDVYYTDCVIGGPGAFVLPVHEPEALATAIRQKLVLEIAGVPARLLPAQATTPAATTDCLVGERQRRSWSDP